MSKFGELIAGQLHTAYAKVADAIFSLGYFEDVDQRKLVGKAIGNALTVFEDELRQLGLYDIEVADDHAASVLAKSVGRLIDGMESRLGRRFTNAEVAQLTKGMVRNNRVDLSGDVDLWGSAGRTGTDVSDDTSSGKHPPVQQMSYNGGGDGHPDYEYSRPLEDEDRLMDFVGKASLGMDDNQATGQDDPTVFHDGPTDGDIPSEGMVEADTNSPTASPRQVAKENIDRPVTLEVSDTFEDGPSVRPKTESPQRPEPRLESDERGVERNPLNLKVGSQDAVTMGQLHRTMFKRTLRDKRYDLAVVERGEDGTMRILEESLQ